VADQAQGDATTVDSLVRSLEIRARKLEILEHTLGPDHPTTARSYGSVAPRFGTLGNHRGDRRAGSGWCRVGGAVRLRHGCG